jgi:hypothetical protein
VRCDAVAWAKPLDAIPRVTTATAARRKYSVSIDPPLRTPYAVAKRNCFG